ncbi:hypothetical protein OCU04_002221 [Sclerotinia nivalis]|uniref:Uncharacterized protein n=1 Tax=Sclerotinia nivalis TaxID=352851 RepID=A0A9X0AZP6_9HELO|nr:hypothetical protein OCU04_002221 [Sclerotinia nivalis]
MRTTASRVDFVNLEVIRDRRAKAAFKESLTRDFNIERNEEDEHSEDFDTKTKAAVPDNFFSDIPAINTGDLEAADEEIFREAVQEAGEAGAPENTNKHSNTSVWMSSIFGNWMGGLMKDTSETTSYKGHDKDGEGADSIHRHEDDEGNHEEEDDWVLT